MSYPCGKVYADIEQGTPEWDAVRCGKASGSHMADVTMKKDKAGYQNYWARLIGEGITGNIEEEKVTYDMLQGIELEPDARGVYEYKKDVLVTQVGFIDHPHIEMSGSSPDGLVGDDGGIEIKCVIRKTHLVTMLTGKISTKYVKQMQWLMACSGRLWCDFVSYCPALGVDLQLHVIKVERDDKMIKELETAVILLNKDVLSTIAQLHSL
jgi:putative phage-type endonuclease